MFSTLYLGDNTSTGYIFPATDIVVFVAATPLAKRLFDMLGDSHVARDLETVLALYQQEVRPASPEAFHAWVWRDAPFAVMSYRAGPRTGCRLVLPGDWPVAEWRADI